MKLHPDGFHLTVEELATVPVPYPVVRLVDAVLARNKDAEEAFYQILLPVVRHFIHRGNTGRWGPTGIHSHDDQDTCQDVLVRLMFGDSVTPRNPVPRESPLKAWLQYDGSRRMSLYRYVQKHVYWYVIDQRRRHRCSATDALAPTGEPLTPEQEVQLASCCRKCWGMMTPWQREILEHVAVMGHSLSEAASKLGTSEATASRWLKKAKAAFRNCLEQNCPGELLPF